MLKVINAEIICNQVLGLDSLLCHIADIGRFHYFQWDSTTDVGRSDGSESRSYQVRSNWILEHKFSQRIAQFVACRSTSWM